MFMSAGAKIINTSAYVFKGVVSLILMCLVDGSHGIHFSTGFF